MAFEIKRNDLRPRWRVQLMANNAPVDLSVVGAVRFTMKQGATAKVNKASMNIVDAALGIVEYVWTLGDTDTAGDYTAEVEVDWGAGELQSWPSSGYFTIKINEDLA